MSQNRKEFLKTGIAGLAGIGAFRATEVAANKDNLAGNGIIQKNTDQVSPTKPVVICTRKRRQLFRCSRIRRQNC